MEKQVYYFYVRDVSTREMYTWHEYLDFTPSFGMKFKSRSVRDVMEESTGHSFATKNWDHIRVTNVEVYQYGNRQDVIKVYGEGF